jgi:lysozyme family protein
MNKLKLIAHKIGDYTGLSPAPGPDRSPKALGLQPSSFIAPPPYLAQWQHAQIRPEYGSLVDKCAKTVIAGRSEYTLVEKATGVPWYVVGCIHGLESSWNFHTYLHNGDPLGRPTTHVPAGILFGANDWHGAAIDALTRERLARLPAWPISALLYRCERYNGLGYLHRGVPSPYVWSMTTQYVSGKYVRDGVYDPKAVSRQVGVAAMLKALVHMGVISIIEA